MTKSVRENVLEMGRQLAERVQLDEPGSGAFDGNGRPAVGISGLKKRCNVMGVDLILVEEIS